MDIPFRVLDTIFQVLSIIFELPAITYILGEYVPNMKVWYFSEKEKLKFSLVEGQRARFVSWGSFGPHKWPLPTLNLSKLVHLLIWLIF